MPNVNALQYGVSDEELIRRSHRLERDRVAATIMEPGLDYPGPGAVANAVSDAAGVPEQPTDAKDAAKKGIMLFADQVLWRTVWGDITLLSIIGLDIAAAATQLKGWKLEKKVALLALNFILLAVFIVAMGLLITMLCIFEDTCRAQILGWWSSGFLGIGLWWVNL